MKTYNIPKGKHLDLNLHRILTRLKPIRIRKGLTIKFEARILTEPYDIRPDPDQNDRHKLFGVGLKWFTLKNNKNAALISFQPDPANNRWNLAPYANRSFGWETGLNFPVKTGEYFTGEIYFEEKNVISFTLNNGLTDSFPFIYDWDFTPKYGSILLPWHGGKDNDGNGIGGVSPVDLEIKMSYTID